jgi:hypothetical protein
MLEMHLIVMVCSDNYIPSPISTPATPQLSYNFFNSVPYPIDFALSQWTSQKALPRLGESGQMLG